MKRLLACTTAVLLTTALAACGNGDSNESSSSSASSATSSTATTSQSPSDSMSSSASDTATSSSSPSTAAGATGTEKAITMAELKKHADEQSCWTAIDGKVYDVTQWIGQHPGGPDKIKGLCGNDGSAAFNGQHSNDKDPHERLASFQIGTLAG